MQSRATTQDGTDTHALVGEPRGHQPSVGQRSVGQRLRARIRSDYQEDGVFRPVRLSLAVDLGIAAAIIVVAIASFAGFFVWLAQTRVP